MPSVETHYVLNIHTKCSIQSTDAKYCMAKCDNSMAYKGWFSLENSYICNRIRISSNCVKLILWKDHLSTFRVSKDAVFLSTLIVRCFDPEGLLSSVSHQERQQNYVFRHSKSGKMLLSYVCLLKWTMFKGIRNDTKAYRVSSII